MGLAGASIVKNGKALNGLWKGQDVVEAAAVSNATRRVASESGSSSTSKTLYHYTNEKGIVESKKLNPSLKVNNPNDCFYGEGSIYLI